MDATYNAQSALRHLDRLFIGGRWVAPVDNGTIEIISPATEQIIARVAEARAIDVDRAVHAARDAFDNGPWPRTRPAERADMLKRLAQALEARHAELGSALTAQIGCLAAASGFSVAAGTDNVINASENGRKFAFEDIVSTAAADNGLVVHEPVGVVAAIAPWNGPYMLMTAKIAPALMAGCTVIMKPAPETPLEAYIIAECAEEIGLPPGVLNLVTAHREAADHLICNPGIDHVSFTGSTAVGRRIATVCGERLARYTLELGGKSAAIVLDDFSIEDAAKLLTGTITLMSGQVCAMLSRAIVPRTRHDALAQAIADEMQKIRIGYPDQPDTQMGPLAMVRQRDRVEHYIKKGQAEGATLVTGGKRPANLDVGYFIEPTLFANVDNHSAIAQEEIFGPVLSLIPCDDVDDAIRIANDSNFGLHGSVLTHDADATYKIGRRIRTGAFAQNGMKVDFNLPFGGFKQSGIGREGGTAGLVSYLETKTMLFDGVPDRSVNA